MIDTKKQTRRGRPRSFDRDEAVATALHLFRQRGYDGVGVAELSEALGIKPPSLYAAFGNKHGLFEEALRHYAAEEGRFVREAITGANTFEEAVENLLIAAAKNFSRREDQPGCLILEGTGNCIDIQAQATARTMRGQMKRFLQERFHAYRQEDSAALAEYVLIAMTGLSGAARQGVQPKILLAAARRFARAITAE